MSLDDLINVSITANTKSPSVASFGTPLIAAYHTHYADRVRSYSDPSGLVSDGFSTLEPAYLAATVLCEQNPRPPTFKIGRRALPPTQVLTLACNDATTGDVYNLSVGGSSVTYTVPSGSPTTTTVATAIAALISALALSGVVVTHTTNVITLTQTAGTLVDVQPDVLHMSLADVTTDPGIATDLAAINAADSGWYGLALDSMSSAECQAAAAWVEANTKIFVPNNSDTINGSTPSGDTTSLLAKVMSFSYARTIVLFSQTQLLSYSGLAWLAGRLTATPGSDNWAYKTLAGVAQDSLTETVYTNVLAKNGNVYIDIAGLGTTLKGTSGAGEFADITRFVDWLKATIQQQVFAQLVNAPKIPYTDKGAQAIVTTIMGVLAQGEAAGGLAPGYTCTAPLVATQSQTDRNSRNFPGIAFVGTLAGAINDLDISGTVSP